MYLVLRQLCKNPHGLFFAGDTAQSISLGSSFRFNELKASLYRMEHADLHVQQHRREAVQPKFFQLSVNYRSHSGIVNAAASIVRLLTTLFPKSIDVLKEEEGIVSLNVSDRIFRT
jgi:ATP-dependent exoDNAse (exonuclease V) beta subunit